MPQSEIPKVFENNFEPSFEQEACGYKPLLYKISVSLGLAQKESSELVAYVCQAECKNYAYQNKNFTPKVWLSKALVRHCVLKINSVMFSQKENSSQTSLIPFYMSKIPFSFRLAYILLQSFEFTETEVAQILNLTPMQVRERLSKAMAIVKSYHCKQA
ncbi:MAG: hypothetical protein ACTHOF_10195 [Flavisolibacter sp.]